MTVHAIWVINKAGGLVFSRSYSDVLPPLPLNTILILAGTLHGVHAITSRLTPDPKAGILGGGGGGGMESFEAEGWGGRIYLTGTERELMKGTKFVVLHSIPHAGLEDLLRRIYEILMKNPFHTPEMPINSALFESRLQNLVSTANNG